MVGGQARARRIFRVGGSLPPSRAEITDDKSIVHLGLARASTHTHDIAKSLRNEFPDARNAYVLPGEDVSRLFKEGIWKRQADDLLEELQEGEKMNDHGDSRKNPVIFVCWGTIGGIMLKQVY